MTQRLFGSSLVVVVCLLAAQCTPQDRPDYMFWLDGEAIYPQSFSLDGDMQSIRPGDPIAVRSRESRYVEQFLTLGEERSCSLATRPEDGSLLLNPQDQHSRIVGIRIFLAKKASAGAHEVVLVNPLDTMSVGEIKSVWGIRLHCWPEGVEKQLADIDVTRTCVTVGDSAVLGRMDDSLPEDRAGMPFPPLPEGLRYLIVEDISTSIRADYTSLQSLEQLVFLSLQSGAREGFDVSIISGNRHLRYLRILDSRIANGHRLSEFAGLRSLDIRRTTGLDNLDFARSMTQLKLLRLDGTDVSSLSALSNSPSIQVITATRTPVTDLPSGELASLRVLNVLSSKVTRDLAEQFADVHPGCVVHHSWAGSLRNELDGADRLRLTSDISIDPREELFMTTDRAEIMHLITSLEFDENRSGSLIKELPLRTLEFYRGSQRIAAIGCVFATALRWNDGPWPGDGILTEDSKSFFKNWLKEKGATGLLR